MIHGRHASFRTGYLSVLLPASTPEHRIPSLVRQMVVDALAAAGEWPTRVKIVRASGRTSAPMKRSFVEYRDRAHGEATNRRTSSTDAAGRPRRQTLRGWRPPESLTARKTDTN